MKPHPIVAASMLAASVVGAGFILFTTRSSDSASGSTTVYVVSATTGDVVEIDPDTLDTETITLGTANLRTVAVAGDYLYYAGAAPGSRGTIGRYDLVSGENDPDFFIEEFYAPTLRTSPTEPDVLFVGEQGLSPANIQRWSVPSEEGNPTLLARTEHGPMGSNLQDFEVSEDGSRIWTACGAPYEFLELSPSDLQLNGRIFPAVPYPNSVDAVSVGNTEYLLGGTYSDTESIHLYETAEPTSEPARYGGTQTDAPGSVALSPDATRIYRAVRDDDLGFVETLAADMGTVVSSTSAALSEYFVDGIQVDPASERVFVSLADGVGVFEPDGTFVETVPVAGAGQIVIT